MLALEAGVLPAAGEALGTSFDVMGDMIPWMVESGMRVEAYIHQGPWYGVGSMERYAKLDPSLLKDMLASTKEEYSPTHTIES